MASSLPAFPALQYVPEPILVTAKREVAFSGGLMDGLDASWYADTVDTPLTEKLTTTESKIRKQVTTTGVDERPAPVRKLARLDSEQAVQLFLSNSSD